ncbi:MAG TPA: DMT family transporter [Rhodocyclaceae bacterium]|nr:DMT family transporter [Rhodocyclaceae bacterium]
MNNTSGPEHFGPDMRPAEIHGVGLLILALFFFAALDATSKYLAQTHSVPKLIWIRYSVHCLLMLIFLGPRMGRRLLATRQPVYQVLRALILLCCTGFGVTAYSLMPLGETTAIAFVSPLIVAVLAGPWLGEKLTPTRWLAIGIGLLGVILIARPGGETNLVGTACALGAAFCLAVYQLLTRQLSAGENSLTLLFYTALVGALAMTLALPWIWGGPSPTTFELALMIGLGIFGGSGHWLMIRALRRAPASLLAPFMYLQVVWASLLGITVFGHWPDAVSLIGMGVIVGSGLFLAWNTHRNQKP